MASSSSNPRESEPIERLSCEKCKFACIGFSSTKKQPNKCVLCECDASIHTRPVETRGRRKRNVPSRLGSFAESATTAAATTATDIVVDDNTNDSNFADSQKQDDDDNDDDDDDDDKDDKVRKVKRARRSPAPSGAPPASAANEPVLTAEELVAEFIALPPKIESEILAPLRLAFNGKLPGYADELQEAINTCAVELSTNRDNLYSLAAIGTRGGGKSWQLNELAGAAVLPSAAGVRSVTTAVIRLRHATSARLPPPPIASQPMFTLVLRLPSVAELADRLKRVRNHSGPSTNAQIGEPPARIEVHPNPFGKYDAEDMSAYADNPQRFKDVFSALRDGVSVLNGVSSQTNDHVAVAEQALAPLRAIARRAGAAAMAVDGACVDDCQLDSSECVIVGSFASERADRAVQHVIQLLCDLADKRAAPLLYVMDVCSDAFAFPRDFQLVDLPGTQDIVEWPHIHALAQHFASKSSWLVVPNTTRYPSADDLKNFMELLPVDGSLDVVPALVFAMHVTQASERAIFRTELLLRASEAVGRFNANVEGRRKLSNVVLHTAMFDDSVQILDRFPPGPQSRLPDADDRALEVFDRLRWLRTQHTLSLMQMKVVNMSSVARVLAQSRPSKRMAQDSVIAKLGNIVQYSKTMAGHVDTAWSLESKAAVDSLLKFPGVDDNERLMQDALVEFAGSFWGRQTKLLKRNMRMLSERPTPKSKPGYLFSLDGDDDDNNGNTSALGTFVDEFCHRLVFDVDELADCSGGGVAAADAAAAVDDDDDDDYDSDRLEWAALCFAKCVGEKMHEHVCDLGLVLHSLVSNEVDVSQQLRIDVPAKIDRLVNPSITKMRNYWRATTKKVEELRMVEAERVYVKRLDRDLANLPLRSKEIDWVDNVRKSRKNVTVVDAGGGGATMHSKEMTVDLKFDDGGECALPLVLVSASESAANQFVAELSVRARACVLNYVTQLRPQAKNDAFLNQALGAPTGALCEAKPPPWVPPVFVPITENATAHSGARPMQRTRGGKLQEQDDTVHLTVLVVLFSEWQTVARKLADVCDRSMMLMILPDGGNNLHPWAHEFALAFTRDVLSELIGCYVDFCLLPSIFGELCELNAALMQLRPVSTAFGLHYMQSVLGGWRKYCADSLIASAKEKVGDVARLKDLAHDVDNKVRAETPVVRVVNIGLDPAGNGPLVKARADARLPDLIRLVTDGSIVAGLRVAARLSELVVSSSEEARCVEARNLFVGLFGKILSDAIGVWGVKTPHASYCWSTFRTRGNALVHVQARSSGIVPILFSTLSVRRFSFFGVSNSIRDKSSVTYEVSLNSMARRLYESGRRNVLLKLIAWRQDSKHGADKCA
jgi:hypothetical protein